MREKPKKQSYLIIRGDQDMLREVKQYALKLNCQNNCFTVVHTIEGTNKLYDAAVADLLSDGESKVN